MTMMKERLSMGVFLLAMGSTFAGPIGIPLVPAPRADGFVLSEWRDAAVVRNFFPTGSSAALEVSTTLYMMHDGRNLWVAAICADPDFGTWGRAFLRQPDEDLTLDESVQVVLGVGDGTAKSIEFGGYEAAQGAKLGRAEHYYEFTVNGCGSRSRTYDESPLPTPAFQAVSDMTPQGWQTVMRIPLTAVGIADEITGRMLHVNAFRFHRGVRYGLHLPAFGGYARMPFLAAAFLPKAQSDARTVQTPSPPRQAPAAKATGAREFKFYPLARKLIAAFPVSDAAAAVRLSVTGGPTQTTPVKSGERPLARLTLRPDRAGSPLAATAELLDANGIVLARDEKTFPFPSPPSWLGTDAGEEYLAQRVPVAWAKPTVEGTRVNLAHADLDFAGQAVPSAMTVRGRPVLAGPIRIVAEADGHALAAGAVGRTATEPTRVILESTADEAMQVRTVVDFDGFMVVKCRFPGLDARRLSKFELHVPLAPGVPQYVNRGHLQDTAELRGHGYMGPRGPIWVGSAAGGIFFSHDTPCFFADTGGGEVEVTPAADAPSELIIRFVNAPGQVPTADHVFQLFLLPTPTRKTMPPPMRDRMALWFEQWSDYQSYPDLKKLPEIRRRADAAHAKGKKFYLYFHMELAENAPGFAEYRNDLLIPPGTSWYKRAYDNAVPPHGAEGHIHCQGVPCWLVCLRGPCQDLFLDGMRRLSREGGVDGVYLDGPTHPFGCRNPSHDGCERVAEWDDDATRGRILGQRQFIKRMRGIFEEAGSEFPLWPHVGGGIELSTLSLCDFYYEGEHLARYGSGYRLPLGKFFIYTGVPFGFRGIFLPQIYGFGGLGTAALPYSLVHGTEVAAKTPLQEKVFALGARDPEARFYPYWEPQPHVVATAGTLPFSYWLAPNHATLVIANAGYGGPQRMSLDLGKLFAGRRLRVTRLDGDNQVAAPDSRLTVSVPEDTVRAYLVVPAPTTGTAVPVVAQPVPKATRIDFTPIRAFRQEDWAIADSVAANAADGDAGALPLRLLSRVHAREAVARLRHVLPADCTIRLRIAASSRLVIRMDGVVVRHDGGWRASGIDELDPDVRVWRTVPFVANAVAECELGFRNGRLGVRWNGRPVVFHALPTKPTATHQLEVATWAGDSLGIEVVEISGNPLPERHRTHPANP
jgi:hypothetical protein